MLNLLNTIVLFGKEFNWPLENALFWLLIAQVALILFIVIVFAVLIKRVGKSEVVVDTKPEERSLQGITLDTSMAQRNFAVSEDFNCDGLAVTANYNLDPVSEPVHVIAVITHEQYDSLQKSGEVEECYIVKPDTSKGGKIAVTVNYRGKQAMYYVAVGQQEQQSASIVTVAAEPQPVAERTLTGLTLDLGVVRREFAVGDAFDCAGLVIKANYSLAPLEEIITEYQLIDKEVFDGIASEELKGCYVIKPDMSSEGKVAVNIKYKDRSAVYMVVVKAAETEQIAEGTSEETLPARTLINISLDPSIVQREFTLGDEFNCDGLIVNAEYDADPRKECIAEHTIISENGYAALSDEEKAKGCYVIVPDLSSAGKKAIEVRFNGQTALYSIAVNEPVYDESTPSEELPEETLPERELVYIEANTDNVRKDFMAGDAFDCNGLVVTAHFNTEPLEIDIEDYSILAPDMSKEGTASVSIHYQDRTVGYRINIAAAPAKDVAADNEPASEVKHTKTVDLGDEETHEAGVLRYDKSFTARYIQSSDEIKDWYTKLKNEMLSYKKVKARMSWKRETFRYGRETVALLGYRGNTLCIFLPLDPAEYVDSKYKVEDVSDSPSYVDTPCMYRLKNERRVRLALELFAKVMERLGAVRIERISEDYYLPYEGIVELINRGLAKRVIKNKADEAIFTQSAPAEEAAADNEPAPASELQQPRPEEQEQAEQPQIEAPVQTVESEQPTQYSAPETEQLSEEQPQQLPAEEAQDKAPAVEEVAPEGKSQDQDTAVEEIKPESSEEAAPQAQDELANKGEEAEQTGGPIEVVAEETTEQSVEEHAEEPVAQAKLIEVEEEPPKEEPQEKRVQLEEVVEEEPPKETPQEKRVQLEEVVEEEPPKEEPQEKRVQLEEVVEEEPSADGTSESEGEVDFSSGLSSEKPRFNGKNRKKHRVRK